MAKIHRRITATEDSPPSGADDLDILLARDKTISVNGENVTFNEYGFYAGLLVRNSAKDFIKDLAAVLVCPEAEMLAKLDAIFEKHASTIIDCVAMACGKSSLWVIGLNEPDSRAVDHAWWEVCGSFFVRCAKRNLHSAEN